METKRKSSKRKHQKRITAVNQLKHLLSGHATFCPTTVGVVQSARAVSTVCEKNPRPSSSIFWESPRAIIFIQKCLETQAVVMVALLHCARSQQPRNHVRLLPPRVTVAIDDVGSSELLWALSQGLPLNRERRWLVGVQTQGPNAGSARQLA